MDANISPAQVLAVVVSADDVHKVWLMCMRIRYVVSAFPACRHCLWEKRRQRMRMWMVPDGDEEDAGSEDKAFDC